MSTKHLGARIPAWLHKALKKEAADKGMSLQDLVIEKLKPMRTRKNKAGK